MEVLMPRIVLTVSNAELVGLLRLAHAELRAPKDQLRFILRKELEVHGFVTLESSTVSDKSCPETNNG
jgi:hypothetical protein